MSTFIMGFLILLLPVSMLEAYLRPYTWDGRLRLADLWLGLDGFALSRYCYAHPWLKQLMILTYESLPLWFGLHWAIERSKRFFWLATIGGILAAPFYMLIPAAGPEYAFPDWPYTPIHHQFTTEIPPLIWVSLTRPRNCVPSMHFTWAILLAITAQKGWFRLILWLYVGLTALATVAGGEHYFVDLILALPFCWAVLWAYERYMRASKRAIAPSAVTATPSANQ